MNARILELVEASRAVVYGEGPTRENLAALREALNEVDNSERFGLYSEPDADEEGMED